MKPRMNFYQAADTIKAPRFSEAEIVNPTMLIATTNAWNRLAISFRAANAMKYRCRESFLASARYLALIRLRVWLRGDLNLQAKLLMLLWSIPMPKRNPSNQSDERSHGWPRSSFIQRWRQFSHRPDLRRPSRQSR